METSLFTWSSSSRYFATLGENSRGNTQYTRIFCFLAFYLFSLIKMGRNEVGHYTCKYSVNTTNKRRLTNLLVSPFFCLLLLLLQAFYSKKLAGYKGGMMVGSTTFKNLKYSLEYRNKQTRPEFLGNNAIFLFSFCTISS